MSKYSEEYKLRVVKAYLFRFSLCGRNSPRFWGFTNMVEAHYMNKI